MQEQKFEIIFCIHNDNTRFAETVLSLKSPASPEFWEDLLLCWLHDPFDKALDIPGHENRAARYASAALGRAVSKSDISNVVGSADSRAAIAERIPMPTAGRPAVRAVGPQDGLCLIHPTSAKKTELGTRDLDLDRGVNLIESIVDGLGGPRERFLTLWRLLPDRIAEEFGEDMAWLPADSRIPDHTLFQHTDIAAGLYAALSGGHGAAFLSFALGPVQPFIAAARSVRDLWSGSALLSWLTFQAMTPVLEQLGPTAFVYPSLRGAPLADLWLRETGVQNAPSPSQTARKAPSLPNRFVAVAPWGANGDYAEKLRRACIEAAQKGWRALAHEVRERLAAKCSSLTPDWDQLWDKQIENALDFQATVLPEREIRDDNELANYLCGEQNFNNVWRNAGHVRSLADAIPADQRPRYLQNNTGRWQALMEMSARLMAATRSVRHVPETSAANDGGPVPGKCTLFGSWEQMGPAELNASRTFWKDASQAISIDGVHIRKQERLSAVALAKRFAGPVFLARELGLAPGDLRFPDTATVAAAKWLEDAGIDAETERRKNKDGWNGQWMHWRTPNQEADERPVPPELWKRVREAKKRCGQPPTYYAVIAMDGDEMGRWLSGEKMPVLRELLHPKIRAYFEEIDGAEQGLNAQRPVGPALHAAISSALSTFASEIAPEIVEKHYGTVIYSGGDDVLALCPVSTVLQCVCALRKAFSGEDDNLQDGWRYCNGKRRITMGPEASMSAGVALVHFKEDLREALQQAHSAEKQAKDAGRDLLALTVVRRSGETSKAICPWPSASWLENLRDAFAKGASNRWTYKLRSELPTLSFDQMPRDAQKAEIRRLIDRGGENSGGVISGEKIAAAFQDYCEHPDRRKDAARNKFLQDFVTLCQSAAFIARGRDA